MRLKEFIDPKQTLNDIVKGLDPSLLKGTTWEKQPAAGKAIPAKTDNPAPNKSKIAKNVVSPNEIRSYILSKGLSRNHAAGMIANIKAESGFNSAAYNPNDLGARSIGFFQHRAERANALENSTPDWRTNWRGQVDFALSEPAGQQYSRTKFRNPQEAAKWFTIHFERPRNAQKQAAIRAANATQYA